MAGEENLRAYLINLDRSPDRLMRFVSDNAMPGLELVRMPGVEGQSLDRQDLVRRNLIAPDLLYSNNSVGCSLSHINCWLQIIADGKPAVVCEDDALLRKDFVEIHKQFAETVAASDIVYWSYNFGLHMIYDMPGLGEFTALADESHMDSEERIREFQALTVPPSLFRPKRIWGLACYTITPQGAEKLLKLVLPLRNGMIEAIYRTGLWMQPRKCSFPTLSLDTDVGLIHINNINARVAVPPIAVHRYLDTVSTIDHGTEENRYQAPWVDQTGEVHIPVPLTTANIIVLNETGLALHNLGLFDHAVAYFDRALQFRTDVPQIHYNRGNTLFALGRFEEAVASYDRVIAIKVDYPSAHNNRGFALQQLARYGEAVAAYEKVLELQPDHPRARINRDVALRKLDAATEGNLPGNQAAAMKVQADE
jgi:GR25 family glycosyltransferase involved in LPS biosynthesis